MSTTEESVAGGARASSRPRPRRLDRLARLGRVRLVLIGLLAVVIVGAGGVVAFGALNTGTPLTVHLVVLDAGMRTVGDSCSGSDAFGYVHLGTGYRILDRATQRVLASGTLPDGVAARLMSVDPKAAVEPTACTMTWSISLPEVETYSFVVDGGRPIPFDRGAIDREKSELTVKITTDNVGARTAPGPHRGAARPSAAAAVA